MSVVHLIDINDFIGMESDNMIAGSFNKTGSKKLILRTLIGQSEPIHPITTFVVLVRYPHDNESKVIHIGKDLNIAILVYNDIQI